MIETREEVGAAVGNISSGIYIVTAARGGAHTGFLASWVQQASFEPLMLSVAIKKGRPIESLMRDDAFFAVNVVGSNGKNLMKHFGKGFSLGEDAFSGVATMTNATGVRILRDALAYVECEYAGNFDAGDHIVHFGRIISGEVLSEEDTPMHSNRASGFNY